MKEEFKSVLALILGLFLIALTVSVIIDIKNKWQETENTITVSGSGIVYAKPELALVNFSVITEGKTVAEVMSENTEKMNRVIDSMKEQGIEEKDLKTASFNIYPRYEWHDVEFSSGKRVLAGYELTQTLEVKIRNMEKISSIIETGTSAGANQVGDLQFTVDDEKEEELKKEARKKAIDSAKNKAGELAEQLGVKLVRISSFGESTSGFSAFRESTMGLGGADSAAVPQIQTGENKIEIQVSITYEIN